MALLPQAPSPPRRGHRMAESRQDRLSRWRFDIMIAATALVHRLPLIHNNPGFRTAARIDRAPARAVSRAWPAEPDFGQEAGRIT